MNKNSWAGRAIVGSDRWPRAAILAPALLCPAAALRVPLGPCTAIEMGTVSFKTFPPLFVFTAQKKASV